MHFTFYSCHRYGEFRPVAKALLESFRTEVSVSLYATVCALRTLCVIYCGDVQCCVIVYYTTNFTSVINALLKCNGRWELLELQKFENTNITLVQH